MKEEKKEIEPVVYDLLREYSDIEVQITEKNRWINLPAMPLLEEALTGDERREHWKRRTEAHRKKIRETIKGVMQDRGYSQEEIGEAVRVIEGLKYLPEEANVYGMELERLKDLTAAEILHKKGKFATSGKALDWIQDLQKKRRAVLDIKDPEERKEAIKNVTAAWENIIPPGSAIEKEIHAGILEMHLSPKRFKELQEDMARIREERDLEKKERDRAEKKLERIREERELEQFPRPPDRLAGAFTAGISGALVPVERKTIGAPELILVTLQSMEKIKRREIIFNLPLDDQDKIKNLLAWLRTDSPPEEIKKQVQAITTGLTSEQINQAAKKHLSRVNQELAQLIGPRGLQLYRGLQRELYFSRIKGMTHEAPGFGLIFFCNEDRLLKAHYPGKNYRRTEHVQEYQKLLHRLTSGNIKVNTLQLFQDGKTIQEINVYSPLFLRGVEVAITSIPKGKREQAETRRGTWLAIPPGALALFTYGGADFHAWGDPAFLAMDIAAKRPYAVPAEDYIEEQLNTGWSYHQGKQTWSFDTLLKELNLKDQYLYPDGDTTRKPWPRYRRNDWIRRFMGDLLWIFDKKYKRKLWRSALLRDPDGGQFMTIPNFLKWLKTLEGKRALRKTGADNTGERIEGALRFMMKVEIGPGHKLNNRHKITAKEREKRSAARKRWARAGQKGKKRT